MRHRLPPWVVLLLLTLVCGGVIAAVALYRARLNSPAVLLSRMPSDGAVIASVDFKSLRETGILSLFSASVVAQEHEYRAFVDQTGFDYLNDLESAFVSFHSTGTYFLLRGRFDWKGLKDYTTGQGGTCYNSLCRLGGSTPERKISFFPLQRNLMALAVSTDDYAATQLQIRRPVQKVEIPAEPVWSIVPVAALKKSAHLPAGLRMFVRALGAADSVVLSAGPSGNDIELRMDASCRKPADAALLTAQLRDATAQLKELIIREHQAPNPADLSGVLASGAFETKETRVAGRWVMARAFLQNLAGGGSL